MEIKIKQGFNKNCRYIYKVKYKTKPGENYDVITEVYYYRYDTGKNDFICRCWNREDFASELCDKKFDCYAGRRNDSQTILLDAVEVIGYEQSDGEHWLKTKADNTIKNNFSFLEYAKKHGFAIKEE